MFASWDPLRGPLEALVARLGSLLDRLEVILGVLERSWAVSGASWTALGPRGTLWASLGALWPRERARDTTKRSVTPAKKIRDFGLWAPERKNPALNTKAGLEAEGIPVALRAHFSIPPNSACT